jgi:hypothetical protein
MLFLQHTSYAKSKINVGYLNESLMRVNFNDFFLSHECWRRVNVY